MELIPLLWLRDRFQIGIFAQRPQLSNVIPHVVFKKPRDGMAAILNGVAWFYALSIGYVPKSLLAQPHTSDFSLDRLADRFGNPGVHFWQPVQHFAIAETLHFFGHSSEGTSSNKEDGHHSVRPPF